MNPSDLSSRFVELPDGRPGIRSTVTVETRDVSDTSFREAVSQPGAPDLRRDRESNSCNSCLEFVSSNESLDRYSEIISAAGWKLENYQRNPVFQNAHQYGDILHTLGRAIHTEVRTTSPSSPYLFQRIQFATDVNPMAKVAYGLYRGKFLNAVSVGFVPVRWQDGTSNPEGMKDNSPGQTRNECRPGSDVPMEHSPSAFGGGGRGEVASSIQRSTKSPRRIYLEQELLEVSAVAIPANPNALALALKSGAVEKSDLKDLIDLFRSTLDKVRTTSPSSPSSNKNFQILQTLNRILKS